MHDHEDQSTPADRGHLLYTQSTGLPSKTTLDGERASIGALGCTRLEEQCTPFVPRIGAQSDEGYRDSGFRVSVCYHSLLAHVSPQDYKHIQHDLT